MNRKDLGREEEQEAGLPPMRRGHWSPPHHSPYGFQHWWTGQRKTGRLRPRNAPVRLNPEGRFFFIGYFPRGLQIPPLERGRKPHNPCQLSDLGQDFNLSVAQFFNLSNGDGRGTYLTDLLGGLNVWIYMVCRVRGIQGSLRTWMGGKVAFLFYSLLKEIYYAFNKYRQKSQE